MNFHRDFSAHENLTESSYDLFQKIESGNKMRFRLSRCVIREIGRRD